MHLPVMINYNAFILSHTSMPVVVPEQKEIDTFLPKRYSHLEIDVDNPMTFGNIIIPHEYEKVRKEMQDAQNMQKS
jgi:pyruvate/2-oxoacid:ferredoxin oxidoreductase alpha subunit